MRIMENQLDNDLLSRITEIRDLAQLEMTLARMTTLEEVSSYLREHFPYWMVYQGGHHVALHRTPYSDRALLVTEGD
jgi:hypothetical protein